MKKGLITQIAYLYYWINAFQSINTLNGITCNQTNLYPGEKVYTDIFI